MDWELEFLFEFMLWPQMQIIGRLYLALAFTGGSIDTKPPEHIVNLPTGCIIVAISKSSQCCVRCCINIGNFKLPDVRFGRSCRQISVRVAFASICPILQIIVQVASALICLILRRPMLAATASIYPSPQKSVLVPSAQSQSY
jgi:hypothetical protein